jgi:phosphatidylserine/phosphatidylglycerophosphate/cardiolipin synthase-like enzyme
VPDIFSDWNSNWLKDTAHFDGSLSTTTVTGTLSTLGSADLLQHCFSPGGNCARLLISWFDKAQVSIHALIYSFTLNNVRDALIRAKNRGVDVKIVMDKSNIDAPGSAFNALRSAGISVRIDSNRALMHDKFAIIDGHIIITGSYNWTNTANEENNENLVVIDNEAWAHAFEDQFQEVYRTAR